METKKTELPKLIKGSSTYKLIVPAKVEEKIRYLQRKYPSTEWSGVLFTTHEGTFEDNNLVITCQDIYPMDLGNATFTEYKMDENVAGYMAQNIELFGCDLQLIHSHHNMSTFFSSTDSQTLREEGAERNCFVSLIVNNAGTYSAAVTRKVKEKKEITTYFYGKSYEFFGEGEVNINPPYQAPAVQKIVDEEYIEYFMLDIEKEDVNNPLDYLDERFKEIEESKKTMTPKQWIPKWYTDKADNNVWNKYDPKISTESPTEDKEPFLFNKEDIYDKDAETIWESNEEEIHKCVVQIITCSFIVDSKKIDLKQWVTRHMCNKYAEIFIEPEMFDQWCDFVIEFVLDRYYAQYGLMSEDVDVFCAYTASAIKDELEQYLSCESVKEYIESYIAALDRHISY